MSSQSDDLIEESFSDNGEYLASDDENDEIDYTDYESYQYRNCNPYEGLETLVTKSNKTISDTEFYFLFNNVSNQIYTGFYDPILYNILLQSDYETIMAQSRVNNHVNKICQSEKFWNQKMSDLSQEEVCCLIVDVCRDLIPVLSFKNILLQELFINNSFQVILKLSDHFYDYFILPKFDRNLFRSIMEDITKEIVVSQNVDLFKKLVCRGFIGSLIMLQLNLDHNLRPMMNNIDKIYREAYAKYLNHRMNQSDKIKQLRETELQRRLAFSNNTVLY